ncbi:MAG: hypothetical protein K2L95_04305 [Alphaproteobacteria bacterium]|nr:hypothetical protein [Alphaproteobacteria bacterium]
MWTIIGLYAGNHAYGADYKCDAGYYLNGDNQCVTCNQNYEPVYCPGDDARHPCPTTNTDYNQFGYIYLRGTENAWAAKGATSQYACKCDIWFRDTYGNMFLLENGFNGDNYWGPRRLWYYAVPGYYLSGYSWTSAEVWYNGVRACTNAPENAHYTAAGTPDAPNGSIVNANDCPWACDDGYGRSGEECVPLCRGGIDKIISNGNSFNIYADVHTSPSLRIGYGGHVCHVNLSPGRAVNAINIEYAGKTFHTTD